MATEEIYPVVVARDATAGVELTLESLRVFPEVIVYSWVRRNRCRAICRAYPNTHLVEGDFLGESRTRNRAASLAAGDWVLALDASEYLSDALLASLSRLTLTGPTTVYSVRRHNLFMGKDIRWGSWGNDWSVRLYDRSSHRFTDAPRGRQRLVPARGARIERLRGALWHDAVTDIDQLLQRASRRSEPDRRVQARGLPPALAVVSASWAFFRCYFLRLGLLEGWRGLLIAVTAAVETLFRHLKRYAAQVGRSAAKSR